MPAPRVVADTNDLSPTGEVENLEVLFFSTRLLRQEMFELPLAAELRLPAKGGG